MKPSAYNTPSGELIMRYSKLSNQGKIRDVTWEEYQNALDKAFGEVCEYNPATSIGFKVMYNQIPPQFIEDKRLQTYFKENNVRVIHLVREAKILKIASGHDVKARGGHNHHHTTNSSEITKVPPMEWDEELIDEMLELEKVSLDWHDNIHTMSPLVSSHYVSYENILGEERRKEIVAQIVAFVSGKFDPNVKVAEGTLLKQSDSCSARIENYAGFRAHEKVIHSRSAAACDLIDMIV